VGFAVTDKDGPVCIDKNSMRPSELAFLRVRPLGTVASFTGSRDQFHRSTLSIQQSDTVAFAVGEIDVTVWSHGNSFRTG
jgi:hypothetical protein